MADRPILFSAPMVRALLDGRKTQTRRILKPQPSKPFGSAFMDGQRWWTGDSLTAEVIEEWKLRYAPGDRLWVREAHAFDGPLVRYYATDAVHELRRKRPSIHMPRWASRLTLTVTDVRVQRLQDISTRDCIAEGIAADLRDAVGLSDLALRHAAHDTYVAGYRALWNSLHGADAWAANPWVVALTFAVHRCNIDKMVVREWNKMRGGQ